jgi:nucleotide-binding universal stress UspA family protein
MKPFQTILVTTDLSDTSKSAFPLANMLASTFRAKVIVVFVQEEVMPPFVGEYAQTGIQSFLDEQREQAARELERFAAEQMATVAARETVVAAGVPHAEICRLAAERGADVIVMATHGRGFLGHALFGSTTERVLRRAPCPVLTVKGAGA